MFLAADGGILTHFGMSAGRNGMTLWRDDGSHAVDLLPDPADATELDYAYQDSLFPVVVDKARSLIYFGHHCQGMNPDIPAGSCDVFVGDLASGDVSAHVMPDGGGVHT